MCSSLNAKDANFIKALPLFSNLNGDRVGIHNDTHASCPMDGLNIIPGTCVSLSDLEPYMLSALLPVNRRRD